MNNSIKIGFCILLVIILCLPFSAWAGPKQVGEVAFSRGLVTAGPEGGEVRFLGKGMPLYQGDVLTTSERSFAIIHLLDESKITLRPNTVFSLEEYSIEKGKESSSELSC